MYGLMRLSIVIFIYKIQVMMVSSIMEIHVVYQLDSFTSLSCIAATTVVELTTIGNSKAIDAEWISIRIGD